MVVNFENRYGPVARDFVLQTSERRVVVDPYSFDEKYPGVNKALSFNVNQGTIKPISLTKHIGEPGKKSPQRQDKNTKAMMVQKRA